MMLETLKYKIKETIGQLFKKSSIHLKVKIKLRVSCFKYIWNYIWTYIYLLIFE